MLCSSGRNFRRLEHHICPIFLQGISLLLVLNSSPRSLIFTLKLKNHLFFVLQIPKPVQIMSSDWFCWQFWVMQHPSWQISRRGWMIQKSKLWGPHMSSSFLSKSLPPPLLQDSHGHRNSSSSSPTASPASSPLAPNVEISFYINICWNSVLYCCCIKWKFIVG